MKSKIKISEKWAMITSALVVLSVLVDFLSKRLVMRTMALGQSEPIIKNVLHLTYIENYGAAFGSFSEQRWIFMSLSIVMIAVIGAMIAVWDDKDPLFYVSASLVLGGGVGNMIDRIFYGKVVDFIDFCAFPEIWSWIFNLADSFVCVGVGLLVIYFIRSEIKNAKAEKAKKELAAAEAEEITDTEEDPEDGEK